MLAQRSGEVNARWYHGTLPQSKGPAKPEAVGSFSKWFAGLPLGHGYFFTSAVQFITKVTVALGCSSTRSTMNRWPSAVTS